VSNTPWGSRASAWPAELRRLRLLNEVAGTVFCVDVGSRNLHVEPFRRALDLLGVGAQDALFVGDDSRWDVLRARQARIEPALLSAAGSVAGVAVCTTIRALREVLTLVD
jgi:putative hydrolase of the HAD superfamily